MPCAGGWGWDTTTGSYFAHFDRYIKAGLASASVQSFGGTSLAAAPPKEMARYVAAIYGEDWNTSVVICPHSLFSSFVACKEAGNRPLPLVAVRAAMAVIPECART